MKDLFSSGVLIDLALVVIGMEMLALLVLRRPTLRPLDVIGQLLAGALLLGALRCVIAGVDYRYTLLLLSLSFPAHVFDLVRRSRAKHATIG
jgi:hypothetical protein